MKRKYILIIFIFTFSGILAQNKNDNSIISLNIDEITVFRAYVFKNTKEEKKYKNLEEDLNVLYPMLLIVRNDFVRINKELELYKGDRRKEFLKWYQNYAKEKYIHHLAGLNVRQGRLFIKMISRELNTSPFEIIKEYRNGFNAVIWQIAANFYFTNLKTDYSVESNPMIEHIMKKIENRYS